MATQTEAMQGDRSVVTLTKELLRESEALARAEVALVKTELNEKIDEAQKGIVAMLGGAMTLAAGLLVLLLAAVFALDRVLELWLAALIVGAATSLVGGIMLASGKQKMEGENLKPKRTIEEFQRGASLTKEQVR